MPLLRAAFTPLTPPLTAIPGTVLFLPATSSATLLDDASGSGVVVTGGGGETCGDAPSTATASVTGTRSIVVTLRWRLSER